MVKTLDKFLLSAIIKVINKHNQLTKGAMENEITINRGDIFKTYTHVSIEVLGITVSFFAGTYTVMVKCLITKADGSSRRVEYTMEGLVMTIQAGFEKVN